MPSPGRVAPPTVGGGRGAAGKDGADLRKRSAARAGPVGRTRVTPRRSRAPGAERHGLLPRQERRRYRGSPTSNMAIIRQALSWPLNRCHAPSVAVAGQSMIFCPRLRTWEEQMRGKAVLLAPVSGDRDYE